MSTNLARSLDPVDGREGGKRGKTCGVRQAGREAPNPRKVMKKRRKNQSGGRWGFAGIGRDRRPNCSRSLWFGVVDEAGRRWRGRSCLLIALLCFVPQAAAPPSVRPRLPREGTESEGGRSNRPTGGRVGLVHAWTDGSPRCRRERRREVRPVQRVAPWRDAWGRK